MNVFSALEICAEVIPQRRREKMTVDHSRRLNSAIPSPVHWRMRAEEMRRIAEETAEPAVRAMMLRIAADYDRLAKQAEERTSVGQSSI